MDIGLFYRENNIDLALVNGLLLTDDTLFTAVMISLFTDRLAAPDDEIPAGDGSRRGWWGDDFSEVEDDRIGSHLWLLSREKHTERTRERAEEYAKDALSWMIADGVAKNISVKASWTAQSLLGLAIEIIQQDGAAGNYYFKLPQSVEGVTSHGV